MLHDVFSLWFRSSDDKRAFSSDSTWAFMDASNILFAVSKIIGKLRQGSLITNVRTMDPYNFLCVVYTFSLCMYVHVCTFLLMCF